MRRFFAPIALCVSLILAGFFAETALAQTRPAPTAEQTKPVPAPADSFAIRINDWNRGMNAADQYAKGKQQTNERTEKFKSSLLRIRSEAVEARDQAQAAAAAVERLLRALGPAPEEGGSPEAPAVASSRKTYQDQITTLRGEASQAALAVARADGLLMAQDALNQREFIAELLRQYPPPLAATTIEQFVRDSLAGSANTCRRDHQGD